MKITIDIKHFLILTAVFILFTVIGTLSHKYGHIAVAKSLGYETKLHYGSMSYYPEGYLNDPDFDAVNALTKDYVNTEYDAIPLEIKEKADEYYEILRMRYSRKENNDSLLIRIGGPLQTILTGVIGLMILIIRRKSIRMNGLKLLDFLAVFLGLFLVKRDFQPRYFHRWRNTFTEWKMVWR